MATSTISYDNLISSFLSIERLITASAYLMGISFAIKALYSLKTYGESKSQMGNASIKEPLVYFLVSAMLLFLPTGFETFMNSTFGYSQVLAYTPVSNGSAILTTLFGQNSAFGYTVSLGVQVVGVIAFVRGWVLIARSAASGQPPGGTGQGLTHVFGGILAMNIVGTMQMINETLFGS